MTPQQPVDLRRNRPKRTRTARGLMAMLVLVPGLSAPGPSVQAQDPLRDEPTSGPSLAVPDAGRLPESGDVSVTDAESEPPPDLAMKQAAWPLKVVSWHLDAAAGAGAIDIKPTPQRVWRHTFGAERRDAPQGNFDIARLDADVVLLQGVRLIAHARLLFPARDWRIVISRQSVRPVLAPPQAGPGWGDVERTPTTAIAIRYKRGLRIAGVEHITDVVTNLAAASGGPPETAAALAVRLRVVRDIVWLVSAELPRGCERKTAAATVNDVRAEAMHSCTALSRWMASRRPGERVIVGGPFAVTAAAPNAIEVDRSDNGGGGAGCRRQAIASIATAATTDIATGVPSRRDAVAVSMAAVGADTGCLARLDVMGGDGTTPAPAVGAAPVAGHVAD